MEKEELKQRCLDAIDANRDLIIQLGDDVYKTPELGYKEFKTTERMIKAFQEIGEEPETEIAYTGCKVSTPKKGNTRIAVIGELDCIQCKEHPDSTPEGNVHACGHHAQLADLYGCAIGLLRSGVMKELGGAVDFIAIPAEECVDYDYRDSLIRENKISFYGGKQEYLKRGGFDDVDMALQDVYKRQDEKINEYDLSLFIETDKDSGLYRKYEETHYQRAYTLEEMKELIRKSGLEFVTAYDAFSKNAPMDTSERIYVIAREQGK